MIVAGKFGLVMTILMPPAAFDHPYTGHLEIIEVPLPEVHAKCGGQPGQPRLFACSLVGKESCIVVLPIVGDGYLTQPQRERLERHELGHCNGWPKDHDGGVPMKMKPMGRKHK